MKNEKELVLTADQLQCLTSVLRSEILDAAMDLGRASVKELAAYLRRPAKSLYFHVRQMEAVGLLQVVESRLAGKREEAVYAPASRYVVFDRSSQDAAYRKGMARKISSTLRQADREHARAVDVGGYDDVVKSLRISTRLERDDCLELGRRLLALAQWVREHETSGEGVDVALTALLVPLAR